MFHLVGMFPLAGSDDAPSPPQSAFWIGGKDRKGGFDRLEGARPPDHWDPITMVSITARHQHGSLISDVPDEPPEMGAFQAMM